MPNERSRHQLYEELREVVSVESADELMSYLPPVGWADVATKSDLTLIRSEIDALRVEIRGEMATMRHELRGEMAKGYADLQRWTITTGIAMTGLFSAIVLAAVKLGA